MSPGLAGETDNLLRPGRLREGRDPPTSSTSHPGSQSFLPLPLPQCPGLLSPCPHTGLRAHRHIKKGKKLELKIRPDESEVNEAGAGGGEVWGDQRELREGRGSPERGKWGPERRRYSGPEVKSVINSSKGDKCSLDSKSSNLGLSSRSSLFL